jgi:hypothetical protein
MTAPQSVIANFTATVVPPAITFSVGSITPTQSVQPGGVATYSINVNSQNGSYTNAVTLSASGLPTNATASFSLNPVTPGAAGATSLLTIQTAAQVASNASAGLAWPLAAPALAFIGIFFVPGKRRRRWITLGALLIASLGALSALSGCGGGFSGHQSAATNYTITVTGTSGTTVQTTTVQLTVQ